MEESEAGAKDNQTELEWTASETHSEPEVLEDKGRELSLGACEVIAAPGHR